MIVGLRKEFNGSGSREIFETLQRIRLILFELIDEHTRQRETQLDLRMALNELTQHVVHRQIAIPRNSRNDIPVQLFIEIIAGVTDVQKSQLPQSLGLVNLEVKDHVPFFRSLPVRWAGLR
jgi:hypothetical protein